MRLRRCILKYTRFDGLRAGARRRPRGESFKLAKALARAHHVGAERDDCPEHVDHSMRSSSSSSSCSTVSGGASMRSSSTAGGASSERGSTCCHGRLGAF